MQWLKSNSPELWQLRWPSNGIPKAVLWHLCFCPMEELFQFIPQSWNYFSIKPEYLQPLPLLWSELRMIRERISCEIMKKTNQPRFAFLRHTIYMTHALRILQKSTFKLKALQVWWGKSVNVSLWIPQYTVHLIFLTTLYCIFFLQNLVSLKCALVS